MRHLICSLTLLLKCSHNFVATAVFHQVSRETGTLHRQHKFMLRQEAEDRGETHPWAKPGSVSKEILWPRLAEALKKQGQKHRHLRRFGSPKLIIMKILKKERNAHGAQQVLPRVTTHGKTLQFNAPEGKLCGRTAHNWRWHVPGFSLRVKAVGNNSPRTSPHTSGPF